MEHGGSGGALVALAEACEIVGAACASSGMVFLMHSVTAATIAAGGSPRAQEVLERLLSERRNNQEVIIGSWPTNTARARPRTAPRTTRST
ncbi:MAG: acyl-CoA dehydrogenase family protein, partial [Gaiellaceae bacterium]